MVFGDPEEDCVVATISDSPSEPDRSDSAAGDLRQLQRWEDSGAHWRLISRAGGRLVISLCRCDGGEEAAQLASSDPDLLSYVGDRVGSEL
jgi:hypothetical protein